jgi:hypothetical protein
MNRTRGWPARTYNERLKIWRAPWKSLNEHERNQRYRRSLQAFKNGVRPAHPGDFEAFARKQSALDAYQRPAAKQPTRKSNSKLPPFFGSVARTELLLILAVNGPLHVREIARLRGVEASRTFHIVERLREAGLVAKRSHGPREASLVAKRRHGLRVVALDRSHRGFFRLRTFLLKLAQEFPPPRVDTKPYRHGLPIAWTPHTTINENGIFGFTAKTRAILAIAALEPINVTQLCTAMHASQSVAWQAVDALERDRLIASDYVGIERRLRLNDRLPAFREFQAYLRTLIVTERPEFESMRILIGRVRPRKKKPKIAR